MNYVESGRSNAMEEILARYAPVGRILSSILNEVVETQNTCVYIDSKRRGPKIGHITKLKSENTLLKRQLTGIHPSILCPQSLDPQNEAKYLNMFLTYVNPELHFIPTSIEVDMRWRTGKRIFNKIIPS